MNKIKIYSIFTTIIAIFLLIALLRVCYRTDYYRIFAEAHGLTQKSYSIDTNTKKQYINIPMICAEKGWENCLRKLNIKYEYAFYGNSITRNSDFRYYFPKKQNKIINLGYGGDNLDGAIRRSGMLFATKPKKVFLMFGINGMKTNTEENFIKKYDSLLTIIKDSLPQSDIIVQSILPINHSVYEKYGTNQKIEKFNKILDSICHSRNIDYVDLYSIYIKDGELPMETTQGDGIHLNENNYKQWANAIKKYFD